MVSFLRGEVIKKKCVLCTFYKGIERSTDSVMEKSNDTDSLHWAIVNYFRKCSIVRLYFFNKPKNMFTAKKEAKPQCRRPSRRKAQLGNVWEEDPFPEQGGTQVNTNTVAMRKCRNCLFGPASSCREASSHEEIEDCIS